MVSIKGCHIWYSLTTGTGMSLIAIKLWPNICDKVKTPNQVSDIGTSSSIWLRTETLRALEIELAAFAFYIYCLIKL